MRFQITFLFCLLVCFNIQAQDITANELLDRSIAFHDPDGLWKESKLEFVIKMESPDLAPRTSKMTIDNEKGEFSLTMILDGRVYDFRVDGRDSCEIKIDFQQPTYKEIDSLGLTPDRARRWRDYYGYLYGLPMKLKDDGTVIDPKVINTTFNGEGVLALRVTYKAEVGEDIWYFYFNPGTYAMVGYRFYHDERVNDGEYIILSGIEVSKGLRIPKDRSWYTNKQGRLLATDLLKEMKVSRR